MASASFDGERCPLLEQPPPKSPRAAMGFSGAGSSLGDPHSASGWKLATPGPHGCGSSPPQRPGAWSPLAQWPRGHPWEGDLGSPDSACSRGPRQV